MTSVETAGGPRGPVRYAPFSTDWTHRTNRLGEPDDDVFPIVHTPYDFYERI